MLLHRTVYGYCMLLPFGPVDATEFFTPLLCVFISYTLIALEAIASEVAEPFGLAPNALALDTMSRNIERSILDLCGRELPEEVAPCGRTSTPSRCRRRPRGMRHGEEHGHGREGGTQERAAAGAGRPGWSGCGRAVSFRWRWWPN